MSFVELVERAAFSGSFGGDALEKVELNEDKNKGFQLSSNLCFVKANVGDSVLSLVVKTPPFCRTSSPAFRDIQFMNEVLFYSQILPFFAELDNSVADLFPRYYYGYASGGEDPAKDTVIVEDLSEKGFTNCHLNRELDLEHLTAALRILGRLHALSYRAKKENPATFAKLVSGLKNDMADLEEFIAAALACVPDCYRGPRSNLDALRRFCSKDPLYTYRNSIVPNEPCAVLCHGDFCANNILFQYKDGKPFKLAFVDLQRCKYASPAIDVSFLLLFNTSPSTRNHWEYLLNVYYESLSTTYPNVAVPTYREILNDLAAHMVYGLSTCSYFCRVIFMPKEDIDKLLIQTTSEKAKIVHKLGGPKAISVLNDILQFLIDKSYISV